MPALEHPWWLLLLPLPWLLAWLPRLPEAQAAGVRVPPRLAARFGVLSAEAARPQDRLLPLLLWACLLLGLAEPRVPRLVDTPTATGRDVILAIDLSASMGAADVPRSGRMVTRLAAVKAAAADFVAARAGDRIGVLFFADEAYLAAPPSFDTRALSNLLGEVELGLVGRGTAIGDAIGLALKQLKGGPARERSIVLLSDGVSNAGSVEPEDAARLAASLGIRLHAVALAPAHQQPGAFAVAAPARDDDPEALRRLAGLTGGRFLQAATAAELDAAYATLADDFSRRLPAPPALRHESLAWVPLSLAYLVCLLLLLGRRAAA